MYQAHFINPITQYGQTSYSLILSDNSGIFPSIRLDIVFSENVNEDELLIAANQVIINNISPIIIPNIDPNLDPTYLNPDLLTEVTIDKES